MEKKKIQIQYLRQLKKYINLTAICEEYNKWNSDTSLRIDYNALRSVINQISDTRLSEAKINNFIFFIQHILLPNVFLHHKTETNNMLMTLINRIIEKNSKSLKAEIERTIDEKF